MRFILVGASGMIGYQLFTDASKEGVSVVGTYFSQPTPGLRKFDIMEDRLSDLIPDLGATDCIYVLSAYINPNWIFENPEESRLLNVDATISVIEEAFRRNAKVIFLSTELIFDGEAGGYCESDLPKPGTMYGKQKVEVENYLLHSKGQWVILRTGATVSFREMDNCPVTKTFETLLAKGAKMASDNIFSLTDVRDTSAVLQKLAFRSSNEIFHAAGSPPISRIELANCIIENSQFGSQMSFEEGSFDEIPYPEIRPKYSWLSSKKFTDDFNFCFASPENTIKRKLFIVDQWYKHRKDS